MKVLLTGFRPFQNEKINPSEILSVELSSEFSEVTSLILPVEFGKSFDILQTHLKNNSYDFIIMLGQAAGRSRISVEKIALNWVQSKTPDEKGFRPEAGGISQNSELALMTDFPVDRVCEELKKENLPVEVSYSAGTYVCNDLYFRQLEYLKDPLKKYIKSVFIHLPLIKEQINEGDTRPYLSKEIQKNILSKIIQIIKERLNERP